MGIRGIDIQVAIQRAADADKIQQGSIGQTRAGEAGMREASDAERVRKQEQPPRPERKDQVQIRLRGENPHKESQQDDSDSGDEDSEESGEVNDTYEDGGTKAQSKGEQRGKLRNEGHIDILV